MRGEQLETKEKAGKSESKRTEKVERQPQLEIEEMIQESPVHKWFVNQSHFGRFPWMFCRPLDVAGRLPLVLIVCGSHARDLGYGIRSCKDGARYLQNQKSELFLNCS